MILRDSSLRITVVLILGLAVSEAQNARSYDTSDWIPITKPCADCKQGEQVAVEKRATGRVLNLAETPAGKSFFPEDDGRNVRQAGNDQQYLKETTQYRAPVHPQKNVEITQAQLQQYYVTQGPLQSYPQGLLKQNYPNLPLPQQYLLQQPQYLLPQTKTNNATIYNPLGIGVQTINHELLGGSDNAYKQIDLTSTTPKAENQNVQLLYVPVEQLQNKQQQNFHRSNVGTSPTYDQRKQQQNFHRSNTEASTTYDQHQQQQQQNFHRSNAGTSPTYDQDKQQQNFHRSNAGASPPTYDQDKQQQNFHRSQAGASPQTYDQRKQQQLVNIEKDFIQQALEAHKLQQQLQAYPSYTLPFYTSTLPPTTLKPVSRKRRPHQPPLAVYMNGNKDAEVFDVLNVLKNAKSIEVQDAAGPNSPEIFVGPATIDPPNGYAKFDLPYLSNLDSNRVERKVDQLPFFVAPLNYKTPPGYSKIPLPSPHVGSVVVSTKQATEKPEFTVILDDTHLNFDQYNNIRTTTAPPTNVQFAQNLYNSEYQPLGNQDTTTQYYVRRQPTRPKVKTHHRGRTEPTQRPEVQLQNAYAEIHDVPQINTTPPPPGNNQVYSGVSPAPQIRQKQQTSPQNFYPQQYEDAFSSTPLPKPKNFYAELEGIPRPQQEYPADTQPRIQDILSIIPPPPSNPNTQHKDNGFDLGEVYSQFLPAQKPAEDYQKFDQLFQTAFLPNPNLNQVENTASAFPNQVKAVPKPTDQASVTTREQTEEKYTVLEEFSMNPKTTTPGGTTQKPVEETKPEYVEEAYRDKTHQQPQQPVQDYYEQENYQVQVQPQLHQANSVLPGLINELQDQSVRQLLAPALLAPTTTEKPTEKVVQAYYTQNPIAHPDYDYAYQALTTTQAPPITTEVLQIETTTIKRTRGRGNSRFNLRTSTTSTPRRNTHRTRAQHPSRNRYTTTHSPVHSLVTAQINTERSPTRQRFRTRGRPLLKNEDNSERVNLEITTSPLPSLPQPNPYYELEQVKPQFVAKSKVLSPEEEYLIKKYNLAYSVANENQNIPAEQSLPNPAKVHLAQQITEVTTYPPQIAPVYIPTEATNRRTTEQSRIRGRFRSKTKIPQFTTTTSSTTTPTPTTTVAFTTTPRVEVKGASDNDEFYGFIRKPNYGGAEPNYSGVELNYRGAEPNYREAEPNYSEAEQNYREPQASYREPLYSPSYVSSTIQPPANRIVHDDDKPADVVIQNPVQFIGEIRPKFHSTTTTTTETPTTITTTARYYISTTTTPAPKKRIRGRIRIPSRPITSTEATTRASEVQTEFEEITTTRRNVVQRIRGRGRAQFRLPETLIKAKTGDEDVEGGNYPRPFAKPTSTEKQVFQIAIDPAYEEDDQIPYASIHRPKIVAPNDIPIDVKIATTTTTTDEEDALDFEATTLPQAVEVSGGQMRKRGYWKLVKQKPVDEFEAAESQNVGVVSANSFDDGEKPKAKVEASTENSAKTTQDFFDSIYQMFGLNAESTTDNSATTSTTNSTIQLEEVTETTSLLPSTEVEDVSDLSETENSLVSVKTSTSTEISHETEICYKGVCVKSKDMD